MNGREREREIIREKKIKRICLNLNKILDKD